MIEHFKVMPGHTYQHNAPQFDTEPPPSGMTAREAFFYYGAMRPISLLPWSFREIEEEVQGKIRSLGYPCDVLEGKPGFSTDANPLQVGSVVTFYPSQDVLSWLYHILHDESPALVSPIWSQEIKDTIVGLLETEDEEVAPAAVRYACELVDSLPSECTQLPSPDVSGYADKKAVYFEWLLESDGRMLLTVEPDGTVAYVFTFGEARSRNLGPWKDRIVDLIRPCFIKLVQLHEKDLNAWDASRTAHPSPGLSSKEKVR